MRIPLDRQAPKAVYLQIRDRLRDLIQLGALQPGDKLPSIRSLAETIQVNKLTVIEAYSVLEGDGLIQARQGSGYFVSPPTPSLPSDSRFAPPQNVVLSDHQGSSFFNIYMASQQVRQQPGTIDLGSGYPAQFGLEDLTRIARRAVKQIPSLFNYDLPQGQLTLRQQISRMLVQHGLEVTPENLIVTTGSKQALFLAVQHYIKPGDWVIVESPSYHGILSILSHLGARVIGIPMTAEGMNLELLEQNLYTYRPKVIFTISTLHNPTGITTSYAHRAALLKLAERYNCVILEDNAYEGLSFEPPPIPIKAMDRKGIVTYVGTFSKTLMPGLRIGYMVVPEAHYQPLVEQKLLNDLHSSTISQAILSEYLASGHYRHHLARVQSHNLQSRNVLISALKEHFPPTATWTVPNGGTFLWVQLPEGLPMAEICQKALEKGIFLAEGAAFFPGQQGYPALRLNFSVSPEAIAQGIAIVGEIIGTYALTNSKVKVQTK